MLTVEIPELCHLAVALDLGLRRPITREDVRVWVEGLMRARVDLVTQMLGDLDVDLRPAKAASLDPKFTFSFTAGPLSLDDLDDEDELADLDDDDGSIIGDDDAGSDR